MEHCLDGVAVFYRGEFGGGGGMPVCRNLSPTLFPVRWEPESKITSFKGLQSMNMNKNLIAAVLATMAMGSMVSTANAANQGSGTVTFTGSIIAAPCSIAPDSVDQTVNLGSVANKALKDGGKSSPRSFNIKLQDCDITGLTDKTVTTTFTGTPSKINANNLGLTGTASGAAIVLTQGGTDIKLGEPTTATKVGDGNNTLTFAAFLQGESTTTAASGGTPAKTTYSPIVPGDFKSVANFTLAYQ